LTRAIPTPPSPSQGIPVIPKSANPVHLAQNIDLFDWELTPSEMLELTAATKPAVAGNPGPPPTSGDCDID
jgi:diketogulonate reductase-like aldo/keto reductase